MANARQNVLPGPSGSSRSLFQQIKSNFDDRLIAYLLVALVFWVVGIVESIQKMGGQTLDPRFWIFLSVPITIYGGFRVFRLSGGTVAGSRTAASSEMDAVLERLSAQGFRVYSST